ncbi:protein SRG1 isoform X1 [Cannabis sativa]|uniref:protein SRG1 isoform X1 n=1 Tax=Cannabis sativa TaxID=3483 RepID=UPI0029CA4C7F|nr:protein SRG1 isoform X1 [Cannabis sativa]
MEFESCSVIVPSVLEMTKDPNMVTVPSRYIQLEQDQDNVDLNSSSDDFPVINFQNLSLPISHNSQLYQSELTKLHLACKNWGFFQLVNHSVSNSVVEKMKEEVKKLFELPIEEREKLWQRPGEVEGFGHTFVFNDEQKVNWKDDLFLFILPHALRNPNLFPKLPSSLREILEIYSLELAKLAKSIISQMEKVLGLENKEISKLVEDGMQSINMINYPPCPQPEKVIGVKPHSDTAILTILLQANQVEGLQVKKDDKWVLVKPLPNAFIVNVGDIIEILTNGLYPSIEHRVVVNPKEERLSIATFLNPNLEYDIGPVSSLITQQNPPKYKTVTSKEYIKGVFSNEPDGKAYVDIMKLY